MIPFAEVAEKSIMPLQYELNADQGRIAQAKKCGTARAAPHLPAS